MVSNQRVCQRRNKEDKITSFYGKIIDEEKKFAEEFGHLVANDGVLHRP